MTHHESQPTLVAGARLDEAAAALILVHGRGATADSILGLAAEVHVPGFAYLAPQAAGNTWYPNSFLMPLERNEPYLSSALATLKALVSRVETAGIPAEQILLAGFSQGACLASEFAARNARRLGGLVAFSGGLIGPEGTPRDYTGDFAGTPVFLGCSDIDPHIPLARVRETASVLQAMGADVTERIYPGMGHTVNQEEIDFLRKLMEAVSDGKDASA